MSKLNISKIFWSIRAFAYGFFLKKIGMPSYIGKPIFIEGMRNISIGKRVRIFPGIRMEAIGDKGHITISDNVYIGQNCHITSEGSDLKIGKGTAIMANVFITNIDHNYREIGKPILEQGHNLSETVIGENCFIGHGAAIQAGAKLGKQTIVGAHSVVMADRGYPDNCVIVGAPARIVKKYDFSINDWEIYHNRSEN